MGSMVEIFVEIRDRSKIIISLNRYPNKRLNKKPISNKIASNKELPCLDPWSNWYRKIIKLFIATGHWAYRYISIYFSRFFCADWCQSNSGYY